MQITMLSKFDANKAQFWQMLAEKRRELHKNPEVGFKEFQTRNHLN